VRLVVPHGGAAPAAVRCAECVADPSITNAVFLGAYRDSLREAVHLLKYRDRRALAFGLGLYGAHHVARGLLGDCDLVVPVPLTRGRLRDRGYNQAELIARGLGAAPGAPQVAEAVRRRRHPPPQTGLSARARRRNVRGSFQASHAVVRGRSVLLVDDVFTTGSTVRAAASALLEAGATRVHVFAAARTP
jgi:ComF family protein